MHLLAAKPLIHHQALFTCPPEGPILQDILVQDSVALNPLVVLPVLLCHQEALVMPIQVCVQFGSPSQVNVGGANPIF